MIFFSLLTCLVDSVLCKKKLCGSSKYTYSPHSRDRKFWGGAKNLKQRMKLNWNFRRGGGRVIRQIPSVGGGGMDFFLEPRITYWSILGVGVNSFHLEVLLTKSASYENNTQAAILVCTYSCTSHQWGKLPLQNSFIPLFPTATCYTEYRWL